MFPENFVFVLFGATGDLAYKKLIPALYQAFRYNPTLSHGHFICLGRSASTKEEYLKTAKKFIENNQQITFDLASWETFKEHFLYLKLDVAYAEDFDVLNDTITQLNPSTKIFYLSTSPRLFSDIVHHLGRTALHQGDARLVLEKPLGHDFESAKNINKLVRSLFDENQIYRIDHYLGKESVQNLMALRFGNRFLEPLWNRVHIKSVQITIAEDIGIEKRGAFYEETGALRDMMQNHLLQLLCFVAMEPPYKLDPDAIRDEKLKVLKSIPLYSAQEAEKNTVFGQYKAGAIAGQSVPAYRDEENVASDSATETYIATKLNVQNWRWADVPFYLRTGKRMAEKHSEIIVSFRSVPHALYQPPSGRPAPNKLVINLQPDDDMCLDMAAKPPGNSTKLSAVSLNLNFTKQLNQRRPTAYERLLTDIIRGDLSLFVRQDELEEAWLKITPFLTFKQQSPEHLKSYMAGSWGPSSASSLLLQDGAKWHEEE